MTLLTLGAAGAIGIAGVALGTAVYASQRTYLALSYLLNARDLTPSWLAALTAAGGVALAVCLVKAQQAITSWLVHRELEKLRRAFKDVEMALGTEKAMEFGAYKLRQMFDDLKASDVDLFGSREFEQKAAAFLTRRIE